MDFIFQLLGWILLISVGSWMFFQILIGFKDLGLFLIEKLKSFKYIPKSTFKNDNNKTIGIIKDIINLNQIENSKKNGRPSNLNEYDSFTGTKTIVFSNGGSYEGDFINGKKTGKGFEIWPNGDTYKGDYVDGKKSGKGIFKFTCTDDFLDKNESENEKATYEGDWIKDKEHGNGVLFNRFEGVKYKQTGEWVKGKFIKGEYDWEDSDTIDVGYWDFEENIWVTVETIPKLHKKKKRNISKPVKNKINILKEQFFEINRVYRKSQIYKIFNVPRVQQGGKWRNGYCEHNNEFFIFANIGIPGKTDAGEYDYKNEINDNDEMEWEAQNGSKLSWPTIQKLKKSNPYIFVRYKDFRRGTYKFIGVGDCIETKDTSPVYFKWRICDYKESNDITKKNEFIEVISAVNQFKKIKYKEGEKPIEKATEKTLPTNNITQEKTKLLDKDSLKKIFYNLIKKNFNIYKRDENPFKIKYIHSKTLKISYWVFLKNISPAHLSNPDISRIQIENKPIFNEINEKKEVCIPIGYDSINKVFIVWNPDLFLKRILNNKKISIYSRFSDQTNLIENFKEFDLTNDEKVFVVNSNFLPIFLKNIKTYFKINNISETLSKQSNTSLLPDSQKVLFKYLSDVDDLLKSNKVLEAVSETFEKHKDNKDFKKFEFKDWFDLITAYKNHKF